MNNFTKVVRDFEDVAEFVIVYICEAHPTDEWRWNVSVLFCFRALLATNACLHAICWSDTFISTLYLLK